MTEPLVGSPLSMHDPRELGPWKIHSRLGAGGMGVVFYASSQDLQGVALKVIRPGLLDVPATRDRFRREVAVLRSVHDAHISEFLAADLESEPAWLAVEYVDGPTLRDEITANGPLSEVDWWRLARGMAQALAVLERHRITHRDLKPGNVILSATGPQLIDFGIAHPEDATSLTATGLVTGSPAWLSPEQATLDPIGPASDIFALGSLLAYAATGRPPFGEGASVAVLMSIATREPDLVGIDPNRAALLQRMLIKEPTRRPTARQVLDRLREHPTSPGSTRADNLHETAVLPPPVAAVASGLTLQAPPAVLPAAPAVLPAPPARAGSPTRAQPALPPVSQPATPAAAAPTAAKSIAAPAGNPKGAAPVAPPPRPRTAASGRPIGPRAAAAQRRRERRRRVVMAVVVGLAVIVGGWLVMQVFAGDSSSPGSSNGSGSGPGSAADAPPAPSSDQLRDGPWLLERYALNNTDSGLTITGIVRNTGSSTVSADLTTWVYLGSQSLGSVGTTLTDVPAGAAVDVEMTGDAIWKQGQKKVLLEAS